MKRLLFCFPFFFLFVLGADAQEQYNVEVPKNILILKSTRKYADALATAKQAAVRMGTKLDLRENHPNSEIGLSLSPNDAKESGYEFPAYQARGDGAAANDNYISVEYSSAYKGFAKGYYIVVAAVSDIGSDATAERLKKIKKFYPDAYTKRTFVWFGCMH